jgi:DNA-binding Lrp family transcriptional regulator
MLDDKDLHIISLLRQDSRMPLTQIGRRTGLPVTTVFDRFQRLKGVVLRSTSLADFSMMGYPIRLWLLVGQDLLRDAAKWPCVNTIYRLSGERLLVECIFETNGKAHDFLETISEEVITLINVVEDIVKEKLFTEQYC